MLDNFEIKQEVCKLLTLVSQGIDCYKGLMVGKNGKLNDTIEASALWSISAGKSLWSFYPKPIKKTKLN